MYQVTITTTVIRGDQEAEDAYRFYGEHGLGLQSPYGTDFPDGMYWRWIGQRVVLVKQEAEPRTLQDAAARMGYSAHLDKLPSRDVTHPLLIEFRRYGRMAGQWGFDEIASGDWREVDRAEWERTIEKGGITTWVIGMWVGETPGGEYPGYAYWAGPFGEDNKCYAGGSTNCFGHGRGGVVAGGANNPAVVHATLDDWRVRWQFLVDAG